MGPRLACWSALLALATALSCALERDVGPEPPVEPARGAPTGTFRKQLEVEPRPAPGAKNFERERLWSTENDWEPTLAVSPDGTHLYQATTRYGLAGGAPDPAIVFRRSLDGGATFEDDRVLDPTPGTQNDPQLAAASGGRVYAAWIDGYSPGVKLARSADHGVTWSVPRVVVNPGARPSWSDKPILVVSGDGRHVYVALNASESYVAASHDHGVTFADPLRTSRDGRYWFHTGGAVGADGVVVFAATDYGQDYLGPSHVQVLRSTDGGASWSTTRVDTSAELPELDSPGCPLGFLGPSAAVAIDAQGRVAVAYNAGDEAGRPQRLYLRTSADGTRFGPRREVSGAAPGVHHGFPAIASGPSAGDFRVVWQDGRRGGRWNTWYRRTEDGGATWGPEVRLSDRGDGAPYKDGEGYRFPYGDYGAIAVDDAGAEHVIWGEGESWHGPGGSWYTRREP